MLGGRQLGAVATAGDSEDEDGQGSVVPRLAEQFVASRSPGAQQSSAKGKGRAVSPVRPSTPPTKFRDYKEDAGKMIRIKEWWREVVPRMTRESGCSMYTSTSKQSGVPVVSSSNKRIHGQSPSAAALMKRTWQLTPKGMNIMLRRSTLAPGVMATMEVTGTKTCSCFRTNWLSASAFLQPHASIMSKLANSQLVALWHFTHAGVLHGHHRGQRAASLSGAFSKVMDSVAQSLEAPDAKKQDRDLDFAEASSASEMLIECMFEVARTAPDPVRRKILEIKAYAWMEQLKKVRSHKLLHINKATWGTVFMPYIVEIRDKYYGLRYHVASDRHQL
ncbi:hypothetical protein OC842_007005 [Tilletia horrida]|uniref:Uncharacterized protein n=1 Tax=Tilletia horrida TaxID=155126 RepID=A0AAN6G6V6_9BASI|nr:hypothetical protein OC842_007005 [Tilletia horrida]